MPDNAAAQQAQGKSKKKQFLLHPFLFAVYPVLLLYVHNYEEATIPDLVKPGIVVIVLAGLLLAAARALFKDKAKAALLWAGIASSCLFVS